MESRLMVILFILRMAVMLLVDSVQLMLSKEGAFMHPLLTFPKFFGKIKTEKMRKEKPMTFELLKALFTIARFCEK